MKTTYRIITVLLSLLLSAAVLTSCSATPRATASPTPAASPAQAAFPVTITDDANAQVTVAAEPQRIISLSPSHTETLFALGLGDRVVGVTTFCDYPPEAKSKDQVGGFADIDLEKVMSLGPDLVLGTTLLHGPQIAPALRERGLIVALFDPQSIDDTLASIVTIGRLTGRQAAAEELVQDIQQRLDAVAVRVGKASAKPRVYWELDATLFTVGQGTFIHDLITRAGGDNLGARLTGQWPQFNLEALVAADPEVIVLADHPYESAATVMARPGWGEITAIKEGRIFEVPDVNIVSRPGPRIAEGVETIARALHPKLFE